MVCSCPAKARPCSRTCLRQLLCGVAKDACRRRCLMPPCRLSLLSGGRPPAKCFYTRLFSAFLHLKHTCAVAACLSRTYFFRSFKRATPEAILKIVAGGIGMSCISKLAIEPLREKGQLVILDTPFWSLTRPLFMLVHRQKYQGPGLRAFMNFCES